MAQCHNLQSNSSPDVRAAECRKATPPTFCACSVSDRAVLVCGGAKNHSLYNREPSLLRNGKGRRLTLPHRCSNRRASQRRRSGLFALYWTSWVGRETRFGRITHTSVSWLSCVIGPVEWVSRVSYLCWQHQDYIYVCFLLVASPEFHQEALDHCAGPWGREDA